MHADRPHPGPPLPSGEVSCPECDLRITGPQDRCPRCALPLRGSAAAELWRLDQALAEIRVREAGLLARRGEVLGALRAERARREEPPGAVPGAGADAGTRSGFPAAAPAAGAAPGPGRPRGDFSPKAVQNLLLTLGGLLLAVAAVVFTVVSWGHLGIGGRAAVLAGFTAVTMAVPGVLVRRGLAATAETVAMLGVALLLLDCYAARQAGLAGIDDLSGGGYAAGSFALVALVAAGYSRLLPLRLPMPVAIVLAQLPLPLLAADRTATWVTAALAATAAADAALLVLTAGKAGSVQKGEAATEEGAGAPEAGDGKGHAGSVADPGAGARPVGRLPGIRGTAATAFGIVWMSGLLFGLLDSGLVPYLSPAEWPVSLIRGALLAVLAVTGIVVALRSAGGLRELLAAASAAVLAAGAATLFLPLVHPAWQALAYTVAGLAVAAAALYLPGPAGPSIRSTGAFTGGAVAVLTLLPFWEDVTLTLTGPFDRLDGIWAGAHAYGEEWFSASPAPVVIFWLLTAASVAMALRQAAGPAGGEPAGPAEPVEGGQETAEAAEGGREPARSGRRPFGAAALAFGTLGSALAPAAFGWGHPAGLAVLLALAAALTAGAALAGRPGSAGAPASGTSTSGTPIPRTPMAGTLTAFAGAVTLLAAAAALTERATTHAGLVILALAWAAAAYGGRTQVVRATGAGLAALLLGGEVLAVEAGLGWPARYAAFGLLAVACLAAAVAGWAQGRAQRPYTPKPGQPERLERAERAGGPSTAEGTGRRYRAADAAIGLEAAGYLLAASGLVLSAQGTLVLGVPDLPMLSLACAVVGVLLSGTALRPDRRPAVYGGTGFLLAATWLRLLASDIDVVEAYTVPFALVLLAFGWWRTRGGEASSWAAYGSGLASGLLPSLVALPAGDGWVRPLLLGVASLAVLLTGTRFRLQAPAVLGGLTLAAVTLHELAPWIAQAVLAVPRWVPMALGGLLLVVVGATYEARLREVHRLRAALIRMR
ncbi:hypothetical protein HS041_01445 [Planomonospora sp. ID67723]|uniref:SCO7613 C-terminal domain-containing membrane protein n=1 Tax=Planomonospora sp. ID67723 TaxID=2738134 RepID=UPI0018C3C251|nr:hypothetical protein [Planomonospora sp. ID67723]MBG0826447.1 hypothetical protein [Planomonospora sp. ID67723]